MSEFKMPSLGADMQYARLIEWFVKPGDTVKRGDVIADVETEKGDIDVEVYEDGVVQELVATPGDKLPVGAVLARIGSTGQQAKLTQKQKKEQDEGTNAIPPQGEHGTRIKVSPLARKMAQSKGINLSEIKGSGAGGTIHKSDIESYLKKLNIPEPETGMDTSSKAAKPSTRMRTAIAAAMSKSNLEIPHYYLQTNIDMTKSLDWMEHKNQQRNIKERLVPVALVMRAIAKALEKVPQLNGYWKKGQMEIQESINIGFAISLRQGGLAIPAVLNPDLKTIDEVMSDIKDITQRTRNGKLTTAELSGSTITLTSLGDRGVSTVFGVIYPPQVALVGIGKIIKQPWATGDMLGVRPVMSVTLAADHRASDGHLGGRFLELLDKNLQNPDTL